MSANARQAGAALLLAVFLLPRPAPAAGARLYKSGPIQITADGLWVWVANADNDSVSRIDTRDDTVLEIALADPPGPHSPRGLSVREDGSEVWVACHDSDRLHLLSGADGSLLARIDLPWGSGPYSAALARDQSRLLVTLHRGEALAVVDAARRAVTHILKPVYISPLGVAWMEDGVSAWVTHLFADGEDPFLTRVDFSGPEPRVASRIIVKSTNPKQSSKLAAPYAVAEGGYLTFRGHLAQVPSRSGRDELWLPTQYNNINEDRFTADSTVQTTIRHLNLSTRQIPNTNADKVILTARYVHDPVTGGNPYVGAGWDARISGPVDLGFSADGRTTYLLNEQSNDLLVFPTATPAVRPGGSQPLPEIAVGSRPMGLAVSPVAEVAYVANSLSRDVSVVDLAGLRELRRLAVTPDTGEPFPPAVLEGARTFHSSDDPRLCGNAKLACASCHPHAEHDGRIWDFENLPGMHGPRSSMSLLGLSLSMGHRDPATGWGQLHRSGDRDELQDFEHNFQSAMMGGTGFLGPALRPELGVPNAGLSNELDALAIYLLSLAPLKRSPFRAPDGSLSEAAVRGATFFAGGNRATRPADSGCARCHIPETGFVDFKFHDVGQRRPASEAELNNRTPAWHVNTPTLIGVWNTPPYDGVSGYTSTIIGVIRDQAARARSATPHGTPDGLTGRQLKDLAEFVLSIDGSLSGAEVRGARDTSPPRVVRVGPASLTTVNVWFSETVKASTAGSIASWRVERVGGDAVPVTAAAREPKNGDRVALTVKLEPGCDAPAEYRVIPSSAILDEADRATGGTANALDPQDPRNIHTFSLGKTLTVTLGASGSESLIVPVHDAGMVGPGLSTWGHDAPWIIPIRNSPTNSGFVRFDWRAAFAAATGVTKAEDILEAGFSLMPEWGDAQPIEIRRVLQKWSDPVSGGDWNSNPTGGPTWRDHAHPSSPWNRPGAQAMGGTGAVVSDYDGALDVAARVDATAPMAAINERVVFSGALVTEAFRFWFENPQVDHGYALRLLPAATQEVKFERSEGGLGEHGPVLTITYALPVPTGACGGRPFHRGDANGDRALDISDPVLVLFHLFAAGPALPCREAADADNGGAVDISDAVALLSHLFLHGPPPAQPGPPGSPCAADSDPPGSPGDLGCETYPCEN